MDVIESGQGPYKLHALYPANKKYPKGVHVITRTVNWSAATDTRDIVLAAGVPAWVEDEECE